VRADDREVWDVVAPRFGASVRIQHSGERGEISDQERDLAEDAAAILGGGRVPDAASGPAVGGEVPGVGSAEFPGLIAAQPAPEAPRPRLTSDAVLAYADLAIAAAVTLARPKKAPPEVAARIDALAKLTSDERSTLRPLIDASLEVWQRWLLLTPEVTAYVALGMLGFMGWTRVRVCKVIEAELVKVAKTESKDGKPAAVSRAPAPASPMPGDPLR
jgi:hypothetical protein